MAKLQDMTGRKFWNLTVLKFSHKKDFADWVVSMSDWTRDFQQKIYAGVADFLEARM